MCADRNRDSPSSVIPDEGTQQPHRVSVAKSTQLLRLVLELTQVRQGGDSKLVEFVKSTDSCLLGQKHFSCVVLHSLSVYPPVRVEWVENCVCL